MKAKGSKRAQEYVMESLHHIHYRPNIYTGFIFWYFWVKPQTKSLKSLKNPEIRNEHITNKKKAVSYAASSAAGVQLK